MILVTARYSREGRHGGEFEEDVLGLDQTCRGLLRRGQLVFGTECLGLQGDKMTSLEGSAALDLEYVVLPHDTPVAFVGHHQHRQLGGREVAQVDPRAVLKAPAHRSGEAHTEDTKVTWGWSCRRPGR